MTDIRLGANVYGKSAVRLMKVTRHGNRHDVRELTFEIRLAGDFTAAHVAGDNRDVLPTDTMKNTVYALARERADLGTAEEFAVALANHFLSRNDNVTDVAIKAVERMWKRAEVEGRDHPTAFVGSDAERRTATIHLTPGGVELTAGLTGLLLLKTADSAFSDYRVDAYTTLKPARDRLVCTEVEATWRYMGLDHDFDSLWHSVRSALLTVFAAHESESVQHTLYAMGAEVLREHPEIAEIRLVLPNQHCLLVDLAPFGLDNPNEIFLPTTEPFGRIEALIERG